MSKLNILGAQRVKALTEMLEQIEKQTIAEKKASQLKLEELKGVVDEEFGIETKRKALKEMQYAINMLASEIKEITGEVLSVSIQYNTYGANQKTAWNKRYQELQKQQQEELHEISKEFADKKRKLWLCETLEEAKELVGI